jgi:nicotinate-nucleotide--dimethylbenzimidazole phosphoribosyltransferase
MLQRKRQVIAEAVALHSQWQNGLDLLRRVGGFEIAGLTGLILGAALHRIPIVLDGFVVTAAALVAAQLCPAVTSYLIAAHRSAEPGHAFALQHLGLAPLLEWNMRLGEGSGAALAFPLIEASCKILSEMATFESAQVSGKLP